MVLLLLLLLSGGLFMAGVVPVTGLADLPIWGLIVVGLVLTHITIATVTIFLHRHQAHRALDLHPVVSHFFRFWLWLTTGMVTKQWVAVHRKHHARCETPQDPHSPQVFGIQQVLWSGAELYTVQAENPETLKKFGVGTPADWIERNLYSRFTHLGLALMLMTDVVLFGALGITLWAVQMVWIPFWAAGVINGLGHYMGYRNFETRDASTNLMPWGVLIGGEELHNNHHAYPASARLSSRPWEFDLGWFYIKTMQTLGLARVKTLAPSATIHRGKVLVDRETLRAVMRNRVHIMTLYARNVVLPVFRREIGLADTATRRILKSVRPLMVREYLKADQSVVPVLDTVLESSRTLATIHRFREELRALWNDASLTQVKRLEALRDWCNEAEQTSIDCLRDFAAALRGYSVAPVPR